MLLKDLPRDALLRPLSRNEVLGMILRLTIFGAAEQLMRRIGVEGVSLTDYEMNIADIAGLDETINELQDTVILPFQKRHLLTGSKLFQPPKGVLLFGPPGCGKTMIAKATAKASGCKFINLQASTLTDMWYGESQKLTAAVFSLAVKIQPCIIFIDEIGESDYYVATAMMKAQFMSLWDGLDTSSTTQSTRQRQDILRLILAGENLSNAINLKEIAERTEGYSGSDLRELCRDAAMPVDEERLRPVTQLDLLFGLDKMKESKQATAAMLPLEASSHWINMMEEVSPPQRGDCRCQRLPIEMQEEHGSTLFWI
ncbi:hypothetical protein F7725_012368, partial [Dissostichus mawsoni]